MKKCDYFKDLILTDYIDGELDKGAAESLESHLRECSTCSAFLQEVKNNTALPFQQALIQPVPVALWDAVRQNIEHENQASHPLAEIIGKWQGWLAFPRLVPIFASLAVMLLAGSVTLNTIQVQQTKDKDQGEYLVSLLSPVGSSGPSDSNDSGTPIEHYFL